MGEEAITSYNQTYKEARMTKKEQIHAEIDNLSEEYLDELYLLIKKFSQSKQDPKKPSLMSKLKSIKIDAPEDFAANVDLYVSGEQRVEPDLR